jgi:NADH-quinone oxidoreductase subunit A
MPAALPASVAVVAYLALFAAAGVLFLFANLVIGRFVRPANPLPEKLEVYECGEPTIGSSFIQFDLRFYVVALLFIIFDVEVAFFFPWATVFGKSTHLMDRRFPAVVETSAGVELSDAARHLYRELGIAAPSVIKNAPATLRASEPARLNEAAHVADIVHAGGRQLALFTVLDIFVFFVVLLVGFAYVWWRGDLDWVRAVGRDRLRTEGTRRLRVVNLAEQSGAA